MKTPLLLATLALALVAHDAAAQTLAGTMAVGGITSTLQGIGGMNYGAIRNQARGVSNANSNYQSTLNGLMTDPNTTTQQQQPPPPPPTLAGNTSTGAGGAGGAGGSNPAGNSGNNSTNSTGGSETVRGRTISAQSTSMMAQMRSNPRNILSTMGGSSSGTNQLSSRPRISLRVQTTPIISSRGSGISTRGGTSGGGNQQGGATGGQQQGGGAGASTLVDPNAGGNQPAVPVPNARGNQPAVPVPNARGNQPAVPVPPLIDPNTGVPIGLQ